MPGYNEADEGSGDSGVIAPSGPSKDAVKKLDQIIQVDSITFLLLLNSTPKLILSLRRTSIPKQLLSFCSLEYPSLSSL